jgi:hypothetical protein
MIVSHVKILSCLIHFCRFSMVNPAPSPGVVTIMNMLLVKTAQPPHIIDHMSNHRYPSLSPSSSTVPQILMGRESTQSSLHCRTPPVIPQPMKSLHNLPTTMRYLEQRLTRFFAELGFLVVIYRIFA